MKSGRALPAVTCIAVFTSSFFGFFRPAAFASPGGYVARWGMNGDLHDDTGTYHATPSTPAENIAYLSFDPSGSYREGTAYARFYLGAHATANVVPAGTDNVSLTAWVKLNSPAQGQQFAQLILYNGHSGADGYGIILDPSNNNRLSILCGGVAFLQSSVQLPVGIWTHLAAVRSAGTWFLYVDGSPVSITNAATTPHPPTTRTAIAGLDGGQDFDGSIDDARVYAKALRSDDVVSVMNRYAAKWGLNGNLNDESGNGYNANSHGTTVSYASDHKEGSASWNRSGTAYADANLVTTATDNITLSAWVNRTSTPSTNQLIIYNGTPSTDGYGIYTRSSSGNKLAVLCGSNTTLLSSVTLSNNVWTHLAAIRNGGTWSLYVNGSAVSLSNNTWTPSQPTGKTRLGGLAGGDRFTGYVDDARIYTMALSPADVLALVSPYPRNSKVVTPVNLADDVVIADFDVADYHADNTGVADASYAIQKAIDDCYSAGGGSVWLGAGTYNLTKTILIRPFVTLRGDWRNPDLGGGGPYGTVILANLPSGESGPVLFYLSGSSGLQGMTIFYPSQSGSSITPYNYTIAVPGNALDGPHNDMVTTIKDVTLLNSFRCICLSNTPGNYGGNPAFVQVHGMAKIVNVKGTCLKNGILSYDSSEVDTYEWVNFSNSYWANAGAGYNAPDRSVLDDYTIENGTAYILGDLEWAQMIALQADHYDVGIKIVEGLRTAAAIEFAWPYITNSKTAFWQSDPLHKGHNYAPIALISNGFLQANVGQNPRAIRNDNAYADSSIQVTDSVVVGAVEGANIDNIKIRNPGTTPGWQYASVREKPAKTTLYNVSLPPYSAAMTRQGLGLPTTDVTGVIQSALNDAGANGGGIVYLPSGWYRVSGHLSVPAGVELRGSAAVWTKDQVGLSLGTVLMAYEGKDTVSPVTDTAFITLNGVGAGLRGFRILYPENNPKVAIHQFPYSIRGTAAYQYVVNVDLVNTMYGVDFSTYRCDHHFLRDVIACAFTVGIAIGPSIEGEVRGCIQTVAAITRVGYGIPGWITETCMPGIEPCKQELYYYLIEPQMNGVESWMVMNGPSNEYLFNNFSYGARFGLVINGGSVTSYTHGADGMPSIGNGIYVYSGGSASVVNMMTYGAPLSHVQDGGSLSVYNTWIRL